MKQKLTGVLLVIVAIAGLLACGGVSYKKTKTGVAYKIFQGNSKDSTASSGNVVKFSVIQKFNDSVLYSSHGKMPGFIQLNFVPGTTYNPWDVLFQMKKGDSAVIVESYDTLLKKGIVQQETFPGKKGDRLTSYIKIIEIFRTDSLARIDYEAEMAKDRPRQEQEMKDMQAKQALQMKEQRMKDIEEMKKSGELTRQEKEVEEYLASKNITAQKAEGGTYVLVKQKGTGEPVADGKVLTVKYTGKLLPSDSVFQSSEYVFELGSGGVIAGWEDGLKFFNKGGSGTLYIPGYMAYGKDTSGPGGKANQPLIFDIEVLNVSDTQQEAYDQKRIADSIAAAKKVSAKK